MVPPYYIVVGVLYCSTWGFFAHKKINNLAVYSLPKPVFKFYKANIDFVTEHAIDPDKRRHAVVGEAENHYVDLDHYYVPLDSLPTKFPRKWKDAVEKYTEDTLRAYGIAPWNTYKVYWKLVDAFKAKNKKRILQLSADLGHYVGDIHVPLHTTENYNGQLTGQDGIHAFWESRLPELFYDEYDLLLPEAEYINDPLSSIWQAVYESHKYMPIVLEEEQNLTKNFKGEKFTDEVRGATTVKTYSKKFSENYHDNLNGMVEYRMKKSIELVASLWYSAWVDAGQPNLEKIKE